MNKRVMFIVICIVTTILLSPGSLPAEEMINKVVVKVTPPAEEMINKVVVKVTLPDSKILKATVYENRNLEINGFKSLYIFTPVVVNAEDNSAYMELVEESIYNSGKNGQSFSSDNFKFEILDIISIPKNKLKPMGECSTCSLTCNGWTATGCKVEWPECHSCCCCAVCCPCPY